MGLFETLIKLGSDIWRVSAKAPETSHLFAEEAPGSLKGQSFDWRKNSVLSNLTLGTLQRVS